MNLATVMYRRRKHYAHPENNRTLCGRPDAVDQSEGVAECRRCIQIVQQIDTSRGHK